MIRSMTGYGSAKGSTAGFAVSIELKSVNNRFLETSVRLPRSFLFAEETIKSFVSQHISRGKVDIFVSFDYEDSTDLTVKINEPLLKGYVDAVKTIADKFSLKYDSAAIDFAKLPDVLTLERKEIDTATATEGICNILKLALADLDEMRIREGQKLKEDILSRVDIIEENIRTIEEKMPETVTAYQERLRQKINEVLSNSGFDENRIIAEAAIFADHIAVDEETVRLKSHISQLRNMLSEVSPIGRKLDFLIQEFNREANTIGSKCQSSSVAHVVVDIKSEIEKIREQIQNIE